MAQPVDNLSLPYEERLRIYKVNKQAAKTELLRVKGEYYREYVSGATQTRLDQISSWAQQVRIAAGIPDDDPAFGNNGFVSEQVQGALLGLENRPSTGGGSSGLQGLMGNADSMVTVGVGVLALVFVGSLFSKKK